MHSEEKRLIFSTFRVTIIVFVIKLLGFIKQAILAAYYGANIEMDSYFLATNIVGGICTALFSTISISLLSMYVEKKHSEGDGKANDLVTNTLLYFLPLALLVSVLFIVFSRQVASFLAPSFEESQNLLISHYIKLVALFFVMYCYDITINVVLEANKVFLPGKGRALFQNLFIIFAAVFFSQNRNISSLIIANLFANLFQCVYITFAARRFYTIRKPSTKDFNEIKQLLVLSGPLLLGNAIYEINDIVDKQIATGLGFGAVSHLSYGSSVNEIITTLVIASVSTVLFSSYASWAAEKNYSAIQDCLKRSLLLLTVILLPITAITVMENNSIVKIIFGRGQFEANAVTQTGYVMVGYAIGFIFQAYRANIVKIYYAFQDTKTPMINGGICVLVNILLNIMFSRIFGVGGIAFATSVSAALATFLLCNQIKKHLPVFRLKGIGTEIVKSILGTSVGTVLAIFVHYFFHFNNSLLSFIITSFVVLTAYSISMLVLKSSVFTSGFILFRNRLKR